MRVSRRASRFTAAGVHACFAASGAAGTLSYVESSAGLSTPTMEGGRTEIEFGDVNADGHPDLVSIGDHGNPFIGSGEHGIMVWFGDGTGTWNVVQTGDFGYGGIALADVNLDGHLDAGYGMHHNYSDDDFGNQLLEVALGDGTGANWTPWDNGLASSGESWGMFGTDFADVDHDGDLDLGSISFGCCAGLHVYLNHGDGTWTQSWGILGGNSSQDFTFGDVNGDGFADFVSAHDSGTVYVGDGKGGFTLADANLPGSSWKSGVSLGDVNGDGRDELAWRTSGGVFVYSLDESGTWQNLSGILSSVAGFNLTQLVDMNLDGDGDIIVFQDGETRIYLGDGAGNWSLETTIISDPSCGFAAMRGGTDVDHNGFPDFAFVAEEDCGAFTGGTNQLHLYKEASVPREPFIFPAWPVGGEVMYAGAVQFIDWHAAAPDSLDGDEPPRITIEVSTSGSEGPYTTIADGVPGNGRFQWLIPDDLPATENAVLRFTLATDPAVQALTPNAFTILNPGFSLAADLDADGDVDFADLLFLLNSWGPCVPGSCPADLDASGGVGFADLLILLASWS